jgi:hypothetical protein
MRVRAFLEVLARHARELTTSVDTVLATATALREGGWPSRRASAPSRPPLSHRIALAAWQG